MYVKKRDLCWEAEGESLHTLTSSRFKSARFVSIDGIRVIERVCGRVKCVSRDEARPRNRDRDVTFPGHGLAAVQASLRQVLMRGRFVLHLLHASACVSFLFTDIVIFVVSER